MRYRVDLEYGYASYDESEKARAFDLYEREGLRLREQADLFDDGIVIADKAVSA